MANFYIFASLAAAQAVAAVVDPAAGFPRAGVDVGAGIHVKPTFVTQTYATPLKHPTLSEWAYPANATVVPIVTPNALQLGLPAAASLDASWANAQPVAVAQSVGQVAVGP